MRLPKAISKMLDWAYKYVLFKDRYTYGFTVNDKLTTVKKSAPIKPVVGIVGTPIRACPSCGAPGIWKRTTDKDWQHTPGILVPVGDEREGSPVGDTCPNCNQRRVAMEKPVLLMKAKPGWLLTGRV